MLIFFKVAETCEIALERIKWLQENERNEKDKIRLLTKIMNFMYIAVIFKCIQASINSMFFFIKHKSVQLRRSSSTRNRHRS